MEKKISIPHSIAEAVDALNGLGALLTTKEWERAAIVYAFTRDGSRGPGAKETVNSDSLSMTDFAALNIVGLRSHVTVQVYRKAWQTAIDDGQAVAVAPGDKVEYPKRDWPPTKTGAPESGPASIERAIERNPMAVAKAIVKNPGMSSAIAQADTDGTFEAGLVSHKYRRPGLRDVTPRAPYEPDYSADLRAATGRIMPIVHAVAEGKWQPDAAESALIHFVAKALTMIGAGKPVTPSLFDEIEQHLKKETVS